MKKNWNCNELRGIVCLIFKLGWISSFISSTFIHLFKTFLVIYLLFICSIPVYLPNSCLSASFQYSIYFPTLFIFYILAYLLHSCFSVPPLFICPIIIYLFHPCITVPSLFICLSLLICPILAWEKDKVEYEDEIWWEIMLRNTR